MTRRDERWRAGRKAPVAAPEQRGRVQRSSGCESTGKVGYLSRKDARKALRSMPGRKAAGLNEYRCDTCGLWHLGNLDAQGRYYAREEAPVGWRDFALCKGHGHLFYPESGGGVTDVQVAEAVAMCDACPVAGPCDTYATETRQSDGVWGGRWRGVAPPRTRTVKPCPDCRRPVPYRGGRPQLCPSCREDAGNRAWVAAR